MTMWHPTLLSEDGPVYLAISRALEADIRTGALSPGDRLPTHRQLARSLGVNVGTVSRAYAEARRRGLLEGTVGRGTFVKRARGVVLRPRSTPTTGETPDLAIDLSINVPLIEPEPDLAAALRGLAERRDLATVMGYSDPAGSDRARAAGARFFARLGIDTSERRVVVCAGAQHAALVALGSVVGPGEPILAEALTYPGFVAAAKLLGLRVRAVPIDDQGLIPEALEEICQREGARALYCMPALQNPTTARLAADRVERIADIARRYDLTIIEDDVQGCLLHSPGPSLVPLVPERVFMIAGVSKNLLPGLRVAYLRPPADRVERVVELIWGSVWMASPLGAEIAASWIEDGTADRVIAGRREELAVRHELARSVLAGVLHRTQPGAYHLWLELPEGWTSSAFCEAALRRGVALSGADAFLAAAGPAPPAVRVSLSGTREISHLRRGLETIAELARRAPGASPVRL